jgi:hypothetical protein
MPRLLAALFICALALSASAQVIYEPIRYQYGGATPFYYGGNNPDVMRFAHREYVETKNGFATAHGNVMTHREVSSLNPHVYVDGLPRTNAAIWGYTVDDVRNAASRNAPNYFRKRDLLDHAVQDASGAWHVPAQTSSTQSGTIEIKPHIPRNVTPAPVFVFPKHLLDRKLNPDEPKVALAE